MPTGRRKTGLRASQLPGTKGQVLSTCWDLPTQSLLQGNSTPSKHNPLPINRKVFETLIKNKSGIWSL